jgi:hemerythrin
MDDTHRELVELVNRIAENDGASFPCLFERLVGHTREHFSREQALMEASAFPAIGQHQAEHARVLGEMHRLLERVGKGRGQMAGAYAVDQLPGLFALHAQTMDSALASHLTTASPRVSVATLVGGRPQPE